jgi:thiamine pyrophosphokinase
MSAQVQSILVVGGGSFVGVERLQQCAAAYDGAIAADAGVSALRRAEVVPLYLVGDLDSVAPEDRAWVPADRTRASTDQNTTDLEKAIGLALELGAKRIGLVCASGDRIDHTFNAVSLMLRYRGRAEFTWHDAAGDGTLAFAPGTAIAGKPGERVSLVPAPGATAVRTTGLKYMLEGTDLVLGSRDGISNVLMVASARVTFKSGSLLVYRFLNEAAALD